MVGGRIDFYDVVEFSGVSGEVTLGEAVTGADGRAALPWVPRRDGEVRLGARYAGSPQHAPAKIVASAAVSGGPATYHEAVFTAPGIVWILMSVLAVVWTTYLGIMVLLARIAREGRPMIEAAGDRWFRVPLTGALAVGMIGATLLFQVVWRPWSDANTSWRTSLNLSDVPPPDYTRTLLAYVAQVATATPVQAPPDQVGNALFLARGCAGCHGLDARGGVIGPPIAGVKAALVMKQVRAPRGQMPRYAPEALSDEELGQLAAYLGGLPAAGSAAARR